MNTNSKTKNNNETQAINKADYFSGNVYIFHSFDIGDDIEMKEIHKKYSLRFGIPQSFFKSYHKPILLDISKIGLSKRLLSVSVYNFGVISLRYCYKIETPIDKLKNAVHKFKNACIKESISDAKIVFNFLKESIKHSRFFHLSKSYTFIQINPKKDISSGFFRDKYGNEIVVALRQENERLSLNKKNEILHDALGYYRGDLLIIDHEASFIYDHDYIDTLDIFEFSNVRGVELQYFDRTLDKQLNLVFEREPYKIPLKAYIPFWGMLSFDPVGELAKLRVDISVISERLWSSIKFSNEPYYLEIYNKISMKLNFNGWQESIDKKLDVVKNILGVYENRINNNRYDVFNVLIVILIFVECVIAVIQYFGG
jgi:hypothetical protein